MTGGLYVIVLNWNGGQETLECLESLRQQVGEKLALVLVDNGSSDDSVEQALARFPDIDVIRNGTNLGYSGGMNAGIRFALERKASRVLLLNNDTIADPRMLCSLTAQLEANPQVALVSPAIFYASEPELIWSIGGKIQPLLLEMTAPHGGKIPMLDKATDRDFVTGCAMMTRASVFREVGLLDERFYPGYYEDLDFCIRLRRHGFRIQVVPEAKLWHKVSRSSGGQGSPRVYYLMARNSGYYFRKHMRLWQAPFVVAYRLLSAIKTTLRLAWMRNWACLSAYWIGLLRGWTGVILKAGEQYAQYYDR